LTTSNLFDLILTRVNDNRPQWNLNSLFKRKRCRMLPKSDGNFCQLSSEVSESRMTIGGWFATVYIDSIDWDSDCPNLKQIGDAEDYLFAQLLEAHELPAIKSGDCPFTAEQLSVLVSPQTQWEIWLDLVDKHPVPAKV